MKKLYTLFLFSLFFVLNINAYACDYCGIYTPLQTRERTKGQFDLGFRQDLIGYSRTRLEGDDVNLLGNQNVKINVSELTGQYAFTDKFSLLVALPLINENFKRRDVNNVFETSSESGIGDIAIYADLVLLRKALSNGGYFQVDFFAGAKLPTGSSDFLEQAPPANANSGIYQSAIALGSGSVDVPMALSFRRDANDWLLDGSLQYNFRTEGDYNYQVGNDLRWEVGFGKRVIEETDFSFSIQGFLSGLTKEQDSQNGTDVVNSGRSFLSFGPRLEALWDNRYMLWGRIDAPMTQDNDGLQTLQDHRGQIGFSVRF